MTRFLRSLKWVAVLVGMANLGFAHAADKPAIQSFDSNGTKIVYFVQGKGEPVVLIHGWLSSAGINWALPGISGLLAKDYQVIALDVRGHGLSDKPTKEDAYGPELVEDVLRLLDHLELKKAHIVGYSMGGIIAGNCIVKHPDRVLSGTLGGMGWLKEGSVGQWGFAQIGKNDPNAKALAICGRSLAKLALTEEQIKSIRVPMTVLVGDNDDLIKKLYVEPLVKVREDWPVVEIKDANHLTCILKPKFRDEIAAWLKKNTP
ncbi:MAG TPA: alpha/beta hydrolase [Planctomycetaceae bacterium]|nr:alpha/beta hydrolase [Planctomycetaceae bacterium]